MPFLDFKGKSVIYSHHLGVPFRALKTDEKKSLPLPAGRGKPGGRARAPSLDDNLIIHGDNLHALKALLPRYSGKIKCIYIDPPYNTGNEGWKYNDKVNSPIIKEWLKQNGIGTDDLERHDKWLCMMWPRLQLLKELLADDGVIFVSIDDNEQHHLRMIMNEIFGEENFINMIIWRKKSGGGQDSEYFAGEHDYILCYRKTEKYHMNFRKTEIQESLFNKEKNKRKCRFIKLEKWGSNAYREDRPTMFYPIKDPDGVDFYPKAPDGRDGNWRTRPLNLDNQHIHWEKRKGRWTPFEVQYLDELNGQLKIIKERTIFYDLATTTDATNEQKNIFSRKIFDNSKPSSLLFRLFKIGGGKDAIILDSFAGSGTTAHAVLDLNKEDGGKRKFILVECEGYADSITAERVRRVIKGVPKAKEEKLRRGLGGSFTYCSLGDEINVENMLRGKLPEYKQLAEYIFYTATGKSLNTVSKSHPSWFIGETENYTFHLVYKPDPDFLRSKESALHEDLAETVRKFNKKSKKISLVFAPASYITQKELSKDYNIQFCRLPTAVHKIIGD